MAKPTWKLVQEAHSQFGLDGVFLRVLGWNRESKASPGPALIGNISWEWRVTASLNGAAMIDVADIRQGGAEEHRKLARFLSKYYPTMLLRFTGTSFDTWYWPKKLASGGSTFESIPVRAGTIPDFMAQRLAGLKFSDVELLQVSPQAIRSRLLGEVETAKITKDFYAQFKSEHGKLGESIHGLPEELKHGYATLLLNRLMFIWFLQKKGFLNQDTDYLQTCLNRLRAQSDGGAFYRFYEDYLLDLFFNYLNSPDRDQSQDFIASVVGDVPYINGGIFGRSYAESNFVISIPDQTFESIFKFFSSYTWHLDTRPTGNPSEINPEVIGFIFEQYINYTADGKRESGAYYTPADVTDYLAGQTIIPAIFDLLSSKGFDLLGVVSTTPARYVADELLHGAVFRDGILEWLPAPKELSDCWQSDPLNWADLDAALADPDLQLADESWVEMFARRERVEKLLGDLKSGSILSANDLVTFNLKSHLLLLDGLEALDSSDDALEIFKLVSNLRVIDPTCGSGAFLFASMHVLEPIYGVLAEKMDMSTSASQPAILLAENRNYAIRKHIALCNLYGTDLMEDAVETAKLRLFLALASSLSSRDELKPLPDLDFNLKCGNLVVGFQDAADASRFDGDIFLTREIETLDPQIREFAARVTAFRVNQEGGLADSKLKIEIQALASKIRTALNQSYANAAGIPTEDMSGWASAKKPFHWLVEFPEVFADGGFDVVIGNPPYIKMSNMDRSDVAGYRTNDCSDFYAVCYERSLKLMKPKGRHGFIVMLSLSFSDRFSSLRDLISDRNHAEWWSTYGAWPVQLFPGVRVRNTILLLGPGGGSHSAKHSIMTSATRSWLFPTLEYFTINRSGGSIPLRGGIAGELVEAVHATKFEPKPQTSQEISIRKTGAYWFPAFFTPPPKLTLDMQIADRHDGVARIINIQEDEIRTTAAAALMGKLAYLYWQAVGDDFDVMTWTTLPLRQLAKNSAGSEFASRAADLEAGIKSHYFVSLNAGQYYLGIRFNQLRHLTDPVDKSLLEHANLDSHWRNLNVWYRQTMKATRENLNSTPVPLSVVEKF